MTTQADFPEYNEKMIISKLTWLRDAYLISEIDSI